MADRIAVIGAGLVGAGWAIVFARGGCDVALYDASPDALTKARQLIGANLRDLAAAGLVADPAAVHRRIEPVTSLAAAIAGAAYVQESAFETIEVKTALCREIDGLLGAETVVGSSSSGIPASVFTAHLRRRERFLVAHPVNPPYLVPLVEIVPAPWTEPTAVQRALRLMKEVGQVPILVKKEIEGFVLNRLQGMLLREAWALFEEGYASAEDIDKTISNGLGLRWSFMGPFETIDLNAPAGIADYARRFGPLYQRIGASRGDDKPWDDALVARADAARREALPTTALDARREWRDRRLMALIAHKRAQAD